MLNGVQLCLGVVGSQNVLLDQLHQLVIGHIGAEAGPDKGVPAGVAVAGPGGVQLVQGGLQALLGFLREGIALALRLRGHGCALGQLLRRLLQQMVIPALARLLVIDLGLHRHIGEERVAGSLLVIQAAVVILHLGGGILDAVHIQGGQIALKDAAVPEHQGDGRHHDHHADGGVQSHRSAVLLFLLAALLVALRPGLGLFLWGCTHSCFSPLVFSSNQTSAKRRGPERRLGDISEVLY